MTRSVLDPAYFGCCRGAIRARTLGHCLADETGAQVDVVDYDHGVVSAVVSFLCMPTVPLHVPTWADSFWVELESVRSRETCFWWCARQMSLTVGMGVDVGVDLDLDLGGCGRDCGGCGGWWQTSLGLVRTIPPQIRVCIRESVETEE